MRGERQPGRAVAVGWSGQHRRRVKSRLGRVLLGVLVVAGGACTQPEEPATERERAAQPGLARQARRLDYDGSVSGWEPAAQPGLVVQPEGREATQEKRVALVVGNSEYEKLRDLPNAVNDATDIAAALERLGFRVTKLPNASKAQFELALSDLVQETENADIAVVFYAGHGMEMYRENYVIPVDAQFDMDTQVRFRTLTLDALQHSVQGARLRVVILDSCRDMPSLRKMKSTRTFRGEIRSSFSALNLNPDSDTLLAFSTGPGLTADDGDGRNSPYAEALLSQLELPKDLDEIFDAVRRQVLETTKGKQRPWEHGSLSKKHYLAGKPPEAATLLEAENKKRERVFYESAQKSQDPEDFKEYLLQYPNGFYAGLARRWLSSRAGTSLEPVAGAENVGSSRPEEAAARPELDKELWESIKASRKSADYAVYLQEYPDGLYADPARRSLQKYKEEEEEEESWKSVQVSNTAEALLAYLREYPSCRFAESARRHLQKLATEKAWPRVAETNNVELAGVLLEAGAAVDARNKLRMTPLYWAAFSKNMEVARMLLDAGASRSALPVKYRDWLSQ